MSKIIIFLTLLLLLVPSTFSVKIPPLGPALSIVIKRSTTLYKWLSDLKDVGDFISTIFHNLHKTNQQASLLTYIVDFNVGRQQISGIMAITNDLIWTRCSSSSNSQFYNPSNSSTYSPVTCNLCPSVLFNSTCTNKCSYNNTYINPWGTYGDLVTDNVTLGSSDSDSVQIYFGCSYEDEGLGNTTGIIGFGNGNFSIVTQLGYDKFSYCLANSTTIPTSFNLGTRAVITGEQSQSIKLINSSYYYNYLYVVDLTTITVGSTKINVAKTYSSASYSKNNTPDGVVLDTVLPITLLDEPIYNATKMAFLQELGLSSTQNSTLGLDLCFDMSLTVPKLQLQFDGNVSVDLEIWNYIVEDPTNNLQCITILQSSRQSVLGNSMQLDLHMVYDLANSVLNFEKTVCIKSHT